MKRRSVSQMLIHTPRWSVGWLVLTGPVAEHLDGNTLDYRALQADARNKTQNTVVKLPPTDYHAARILRGDTGRVVSEPEPPTPDASAGIERASQDTKAGSSGPHRDQQENATPEFNMALQTNTLWSYAAGPSYVSAEGYQTATANATLATPGSVAYQAAADPASPFSHQVLTVPSPSFPQPAGYQAAAGPTAVALPYQYGVVMPYYPAEVAYGVCEQDHTGYGGGGGGGWPSPGSGPAPRPGQIIHYDGDRPAVVIEQRKIIILNLKRDGLSEATVRSLVAEHAGADEIDKIELPVNKDGRARGIAFVTFASVARAAAAIAALDGREVAGRKLSARLAEGVSPGGFSSRPGRRLASGGGGGGGGGGKAAGHKSTDVAGPSVAKAARSSQAHGAAALRSPPRLEASRAGPGSGSGSAADAGAGSVSIPVSAGSEGQKKSREERPVIVDGSVGRWKKEKAPIVVDGRATRRT